MIRNEDGFTLVEILIAIIVTAVVGGSLSMMYLSIQQIQIGSRYLESATRAAQRQIETLRDNNYNSLTPGTDITFTNKLPDILPADKTGVVRVSEPAPGVRRVDVAVRYTHNGSEKKVELSSMIGVIGITQ